MTDPTNNTPQHHPLLRVITGAVGAAGLVYFVTNSALRCYRTPGSSDERVDATCMMVAFYALATICLLIYSILSVHRRGLANEWTIEGRCPRCGHDLPDGPGTSCPECGPLTPPAAPLPGSPAVCARCRRDMTGREGRICPDCGAMYGMDYITHTKRGIIHQCPRPKNNSTPKSSSQARPPLPPNGSAQA